MNLSIWFDQIESKTFLLSVAVLHHYRSFVPTKRGCCSSAKPVGANIHSIMRLIRNAVQVIINTLKYTVKCVCVIYIQANNLEDRKNEYKWERIPNDLFSHQFIDGLYFSRNLSHHEDLAVARFLPRFDEGFDYSLIISATIRNYINLFFIIKRILLQAADKSWKSLPKIERLQNDEADNVKSTGTFLLDTVFVNSTNISTISRGKCCLWNPGWDGVHNYFEWRV